MLQAYAGGRLFGTAIRSGAARVRGPARVAADPPRLRRRPRRARRRRPRPARLRGHAATARGVGRPEYAEAVVPLLDDLPEPAVVVGHSFGGKVAVHLAAGWPDRVRALVLTGVPLVAWAAQAAALALPGGRALHRRGLVATAAMERLRQRYGSPDYRAAQGIMRAVHVVSVNETYEEQLRAVACPVELVWGDDDAEAPVAVAERAAALLGRRHLTVCPRRRPPHAAHRARRAAGRHRAAPARHDDLAGVAAVAGGRRLAACAGCASRSASTTCPGRPRASRSAGGSGTRTACWPWPPLVGLAWLRSGRPSAASSRPSPSPSARSACRFGAGARPGGWTRRLRTLAAVWAALIAR